MALKQIKNKMISTSKTGKVTKAMESVSAVKMRKSQDRAFAGKPYAEAAMRILHNLSTSVGGERYFGEGDADQTKQCFVVITSDKGLAGNLNSSVLKCVDNALLHAKKETTNIIAFGKKAHEHYARSGYTIEKTYTNISDDVVLGDVNSLIELIVKGFNDGKYGKVSVAYQNFVSTFDQNALIRQILPLDSDVLEVMVRDIVPKKGMYSSTGHQLEDYAYNIEPNPDEVMSALIPQLVQIMLFHALLESKASEHSARMVAMKNATDKAEEMRKALSLEYNKERQSVITAEVSEITGGIEAMNKV
jgi:F-type H+-transporting ATPase subunit gamma